MIPILSVLKLHRPSSIHPYTHTYHRCFVVVCKDWSELFFDLLFVAVAIRIANLLKDDVSTTMLGISAIYSLVFFFAWLDVTMFFTRFRTRGDIYTSLVLCLSAGSILAQGIFTTPNLGEDSWKFSMSSAISQVALGLLYFPVGYLNPHDRPRPLGKAMTAFAFVFALGWLGVAFATYV